MLIVTLEITDVDVLKQSGQQFHPMAVPTGNAEDQVEGMVFQITGAELLQADKYEVDDYARVLVNLNSGLEAWIYISREYLDGN